MQTVPGPNISLISLFCAKKSPIYPPYLGGVWMVGVREYIGLQFLGFVYTVYIIRLVVKQKIEVSQKKFRSL